MVIRSCGGSGSTTVTVNVDSDGLINPPTDGGTTNDGVARWTGDGYNLQDSSVIIDDSGNITVPASATVDGYQLKDEFQSVANHAADSANPHNVKLDDNAAPDDNTDLDASAAAHGLLPKLSGTSTEYLDGSGSFSTPAGGGGGGGGLTYADIDAYALKTFVADSYATLSLLDSYSTTSHASTHITGGSDQIDGDKLDIDFTPSNYTPTTSPSEADSVDNLTAHLAGIDAELTSGGGGGGLTYADIDAYALKTFVADSYAAKTLLDSYALDSDLTSHTGNTSNPHSVSALQLNALQYADIDAYAKKTLLDSYALDSDLTSHTSNTSNPHSVSALQLNALQYSDIDAYALKTFVADSYAPITFLDGYENTFDSEFQALKNDDAYQQLELTDINSDLIAHKIDSANPHNVKLDDNAATDDNTDLDASSLAHGLLPKLSGTSTEYLGGDGNWSTPAGGSANIDEYVRVEHESFQDVDAYAGMTILGEQSADFNVSSFSNQPDVPRILRILFSDDWDGGNITLVGVDSGGLVRTDIVVASAGTFVGSAMAFASITNASNTGTRTAGSVIIMTSEEIGLLHRGTNIYKFTKDNVHESVDAYGFQEGWFRPAILSNNVRNYDVWYRWIQDFIADNPSAIRIAAATIDNTFPVADSTDVATDALIYMDIIDSSTNVMLHRGLIDAYVDGVLVYNGTTFTSGWDGASSDCYAIADGYHLVIDKTALFASSTVIGFDAYAGSIYGKITDLPGWSFTTTSATVLFGTITARIPFNISGISQMPLKMTINGASEFPSLAYNGRDAADPNWPSEDGYGGNLTLTQTGTSTAGKPTLSGEYPGLDNHSAVQLGSELSFSNNWAYHCDDDTTGNIGTNDMVVELILKFNSNIPSAESEFSAIGKRDPITGQGFAVYFSPSTTKTGIQIDAGATGAWSGDGQRTSYDWKHIMYFINRDEASTDGCKIYENGVVIASADMSAGSASLSAATPFQIGSDQEGFYSFPGSIAAVRVWDRASWHQAGSSGPAEWVQIALDRFSQLCGTYPDDSYGTLTTPSTATRTTSAILDKINASGYREMLSVGADWIRVCGREEITGEDAYGALLEGAVQNLAIDSYGFGDWTVLNATANESVITAPQQQMVDVVISSLGTGIETSTTDGNHYITSNDNISFTSGTRYVSSVFAKAGGNKNWFELMSVFTATDRYCYYDLLNGVVGTDNLSAVDGYSGIDSWGDGWYRCWFTWVSDATESNKARFYIAEADGDNSFAGTDINDGYVFGLQVEANTRGLPSELVNTFGSTVTKTADRLTYSTSSLSNDEYGTLQVSVLSVDGNNRADGYFATLSDGGDSSDKTANMITQSGAKIEGTWLTATNNVLLNSTTDITDGYSHLVRQVIKRDDSRIYVDGVNDATDSSVDNAPLGFDTLDIGTSETGTESSGHIIGNVIIWDGYDTSV